MSCGVSCRHSSDLVLLWLSCRPATALIQPLAWESPYAMGTDLKSKSKKIAFQSEEIRLQMKAPESRKTELPLWFSGNKSDYYP